ncbi:MAG: 3-hydroxyanthranilate 3,4-dioxygenase [Candidatus Nanopelagicales bacterium]
MSNLTQTLNFDDWVAKHGASLTPPVANKEMFPGGQDFIVMVVGGPNARTDFHVDPFEEVFYQVSGTMHVDLMTPDGPKRVTIGPGEMWVLPRLMPHSPQRPEAGSIGLVFERIRDEGTLEKFQWYCPQCDGLVHEVELQVRDIADDLPPIFEAFYGDVDARRCSTCGHLHPGKG